MRVPCWRIGLALLTLLPALTALAGTVVRMPRPESALDQRTQFASRLLHEALQRSGRDYRVEMHPIRMQQSRALLRLQSAQGIDVVCTVTTKQREALAQPIRIPLDKGLLGWRLLMVNKQTPAIASVQGLLDLKGLVAGQGSDWPDVPILRANGLTVYGTSNYASLFNMLATGRIDYFPRGATEVWHEQEHYRDSLAIVPGVALRYRSALYFFVRRGNTRLAADITRGLEKMIADGSFEQMFQREYGAMIRKAGLHDRRVIDLVNPVLPSAMPLERRNLWYRL